MASSCQLEGTKGGMRVRAERRLGWQGEGVELYEGNSFQKIGHGVDGGWRLLGGEHIRE